MNAVSDDFKNLVEDHPYKEVFQLLLSCLSFDYWHMQTRLLSFFIFNVTFHAHTYMYIYNCCIRKVYVSKRKTGSISLTRVDCCLLVRNTANPPKVTHQSFDDLTIKSVVCCV
jgi:hypothetical protein